MCIVGCLAAALSRLATSLWSHRADETPCQTMSRTWGWHCDGERVFIVDCEHLAVVLVGLLVLMMLALPLSRART